MFFQRACRSSEENAWCLPDVTAWYRRVIGYFKTARSHARCGATLSSILLFPIRRRLPSPRNQVDLKNGISLVAPLNFPLLSIIEEIYMDRCYEPDYVQIAAGDFIVDIGANIGVFTISVASRHPEAHLIAVEPSPQALEFLNRNVALNGLHNVRILSCACWGGNGHAVLYSRGGDELNSLYSQDGIGSSFRALCRVPVLTLDDVFERFQIDHCGLLKLDCEGAEYEILFNAREETLQRIQRIALEYHVGFNAHTPGAFATFLKSNGFEVERLPMRDDGTGYMYAKRSA
jgi:FkbM family methyltransferase